MAQFDRQKARKRLNSQKARLKKKGANPAEIADYFGVPFSTKFGQLSNDDLKALNDKLNNTEPVTVIDGFIYPSRYIKARKVFFGDNTDQPLIEGYKKALRSPFITKDKSLSDTKRRLKEQETNYKKLLANGLRNIGAESVARQIERASYSRVREFVNAASGILDLNNIYYPTSGGDDYEIDDKEIARQSTLANLATQLWTEYNKK